jgi:RNA polymerase sigma factor (sigma-70 family)
MPVSDLSDEHLLASARRGDIDAFGDLWVRHVGPTTRWVRPFTSLEADDVVSEVFVRTLSALRRGAGPEVDFRSYARIAARSVASQWGRRLTREMSLWEHLVASTPEPFDFTSDGADDRRLIVAAFASLPERWRRVLWGTQVEGFSSLELAEALCMSPNAVALLSHRARLGMLRQWSLAHVGHPPRDGECRWVFEHLPNYLAGTLSPAWTRRAEAHLRICASCVEAMTVVAATIAAIHASPGSGPGREAHS